MRSVRLASLVIGSLALGCGPAPDARGPVGDGSAKALEKAAPSGSTAAPAGPAGVPSGHVFASLSVGKWEACAIEQTGALFCWGRGGESATARVHRDAPEAVAGIADAAQVAVGLATLVRHRSSRVTCFGCDKAPRELPEPVDAVDVAAGRDEICALSASGAVFCGTYWQALKRVPGIDDAIDVAAGDSHACVVRKSGGVACWGSNGYGQLGTTSGPRQEDDMAPDKAPGVVAVKGVTDAVAVGAGPEHTCVLRASGKLACWGSDFKGNLGDGPPSEQRDKHMPSGTVVDVAGIDDAVAVSDNGQCALRKGGAASCWGDNGYGTIGDGTRFQANSATEVKGLPKVTQIQSSGAATCALAEGGALYCWGNLIKYRPTEVVGLGDATAISAADESTCAIRKGGVLVCWGESASVAGGVYRDADTLAPEDRYGISDAIAIATPLPSSHLHDACAVRTSGEVVCFTDGRPFRPGVGDAKSVAIGQSVACALRKNGGVACWGGNDSGQCGPGPEDVARKSAASIAVTDAVAVAAGSDTACALRKNGQVMCWGSNRWALLGNGGRDRGTGKHPTPGEVGLLDDAVALTMGFVHACAIRRSGQVVCWGSNLRRVADTEMSDLLFPEKTRVSDAVAISAGIDGVCAVRKSGSVTCWGMNDEPRGNASPIGNLADYTDVVGLGDAVAVSTGDKHTCALRKGGQALCWGENGRGQLGNGTGPRIPALFTKP